MFGYSRMRMPEMVAAKPGVAVRPSPWLTEGCGDHKEVAFDDFIALVVIELVVLLVRPTLDWLFDC